MVAPCGRCSSWMHQPNWKPTLWDEGEGIQCYPIFFNGIHMPALVTNLNKAHFKENMPELEKLVPVVTYTRSNMGSGRS